jgi:hypothetical protein
MLAGSRFLGSAFRGSGSGFLAVRGFDGSEVQGFGRGSVWKGPGDGLLIRGRLELPRRQGRNRARMSAESPRKPGRSAYLAGCAVGRFAIGATGAHGFRGSFAEPADQQSVARPTQPN